jgi:hypothetical protein
MMPDDLRSPHPVDAPIREVITTSRQTLPLERDAIVERIASAPFDPRTDATVPMKDRGLIYRGTTLEARAPALHFHLVKRVVADRQWADGTSSPEYLSDLRRAVRATDARIMLYRRRGGCLAAVVARNRIEPARLGSEAAPWILVVFSADLGTIITGYQIASAVQLNLPEDVLWLR